MKKLLLLVSMLLITPALMAQTTLTQAHPLSGVRETKLAIERLGDEERACGLTENSLRTAVLFIAGQSRLKVVEGTTSGGYLYVTVTALRMESRPSCVYGLKLEQMVPATTLRTGAFVMGQAWSGGATGLGPISGFDRQVSQRLEMLTKEFVVAWTEANR